MTWNKPGATQDDFNRDSAQCNSSAYSQFPPAMRTVRPAVTGMQMPGQSQTDCDVNGNHASCTTTGGGTTTLPVFIPGQDVDDNANARQSAWQSCMYSNGWSQGRPQSSQASASSSLYPSFRDAPQSDNREVVTDPANRIKYALDRAQREAAYQCKEDQYRLFFAKTGCSSDDITPEQLADTSRISFMVQPVALKLQPEIAATVERVRDAEREFGGARGAKVADALDVALYDAEQNMKGLCDGKLTWGEYNHRRKEIDQALRDSTR